MTQRSCLFRDRAATSATTCAVVFCQRPGNKPRRARISVRIRCTRPTAEICLDSAARSTIGGHGSDGGDDRSTLRTPARARFALAGSCANPAQCARPGRWPDLLEPDRRARAEAPPGARGERGHAGERAPSRARYEAPRARSTRLPALRVDAGFALWDLPSLLLGARCP